MVNKRRSVITLIVLVLFAFAAGTQFDRFGLFGDHAGHDHAAPAAAGDSEPTQFTCGMHPMIISDEPGQCPICGMDLTPVKKGGTSSGERKIKHWVAPMDPTYIRDEPGKSPMGMDLVPVYEDEDSSLSTITIDPVVQQNMGVRTATVERRDLSRSIRTVGLVEYDEPNRFTVTAKISGWIERLHVDQLGQTVRKGQPLLEIYSPELVSAQEEYLLAYDNHASLTGSRFPEIAAGAGRLLEAARRRLSLWDISTAQIERLEQSRQVRRTLTLHAPYQGIVTAKMMNAGGYIKPGMPLFEISDISTVWVMADIYEFELPWVQVGLPARIRLPFADGREIDATIAYVYPYVEPKTRTVKARLEIANPDFELKPAMYVNVVVLADPVRDVLSVPVEAVINSGAERLVFVALGDGKFERRRIETGLQDDNGQVQVVAGLHAGERVVTSAQFMFDSESRLREAVQKMLQADTDAAADHTGHDSHGSAEEDLESLFD
ncbi:MAG: efflux RND transporter periplasmic adaptor subunit [Desulfuromonadales bacterium]|nr:efflux RND transporter periplasmic adaptor subunit [Desulfuromonadales bacterium]